MSAASAFLQHPLLEACGVQHGFGQRASAAPRDLLRPRQVHRSAVWMLSSAAEQVSQPPEADAVVSTWPGRSVGVVTADCVPVLVASRDGRSVAAVHAGWRGLACNAIAAAVSALGEIGVPARELVAAIGPHIGSCCYEVDAPVVSALRSVYGDELEAALLPTRAEHWSLDLGELAKRALQRAGLAPPVVGFLKESCTFCHPERFFSYRREGASAGRLVHWIAARRD